MWAFMPSSTWRRGGRPSRSPAPKAAAGLGVLDGVQVEVGEGDVPALDPPRVPEPAPLQLLGHRPGGPQVGGQEEPARVAAGLQRLQQPLHAVQQGADAGRASHGPSLPSHGGRPSSGRPPWPRCAVLGGREKMAGMEILVTGAGGFVGGALVPERVGRGHRVRAATRRPDRYRGPAGAVGRRFDLDDPAALGPALDGVELAYYLVHSMAEVGSFAPRDLRHARDFGRAARAAGVDRVVYLSGLGDERQGLSEHLASRRAVEDALASTGPDLTVLRAAMVLGKGGASFEMLVQLVRRLPVMVCPAGWTRPASRSPWPTPSATWPTPPGSTRPAASGWRSAGPRS